MVLFIVLVSVAVGLVGAALLTLRWASPTAVPTRHGTAVPFGERVQQCGFSTYSIGFQNGP
jgi:hypothetical protein